MVLLLEDELLLDLELEEGMWIPREGSESDLRRVLYGIMGERVRIYNKMRSDGGSRDGEGGL